MILYFVTVRLRGVWGAGSGIRRSHSAAFARPEFKAVQAGFSRFRDEFRYEDAAAAPRVRAMQIVDGM